MYATRHSSEHQIHCALVAKLLDSYPCPVGYTLLDALRRCDANTITSLDSHLDWNTSPDEFRTQYMYVNLLRKFPFVLAVNRRDAAIATFREGEALNHRTNYKLFSAEPQTHLLRRVINLHQSYIGKVLGSASGKLSSMLDKMYFSGGSNVGTKTGRTAVIDKVSHKLTVTPELAPYAMAIINHCPRTAGAILGAEGLCSIIDPSVFEIVSGCKLAFVPKNAKTDRSITVEPSLNAYLQNGIGEYLRQLLMKKCSINLSDQSINGCLSEIAHAQNLATLDLRNASNTLSIGLVRMSLQEAPGWFQLLDLVRSKRYTFDGALHGFRLFAGMGNGFTFPLESLIFYSLARATHIALGVPNVTSVYGDDLVVSNEVTVVLAQLFKYFGLEVNGTKSFTRRHPFRESCGSYSYKGHPVKPVYIDETLLDYHALCSAHNSFVRWARQGSGILDPRIKPCLKYLRSLCEYPINVIHPDLGDIGFHPMNNPSRQSGLAHYYVRESRPRSYMLPKSYRGVHIFMMNALHKADRKSVV